MLAFFALGVFQLYRFHVEAMMRFMGDAGH